MYIGTTQDAYWKGNDAFASMDDIKDNPYDQTLYPNHWEQFRLGWKEHSGLTKEEVKNVVRVKKLLKEYDKVYSKYPPGNPRPKWTVLYNISTPGSNWVGTAWEFFDDEKLAQERYNSLSKFSENPNPQGFKYCPTKRPYYPRCDREHLGAVHAWNKEG